ncbi:MAG: DUF2927 domain-containing protein [Verrucomicrobiota bacterium]
MQPPQHPFKEIPLPRTALLTLVTLLAQASTHGSELEASQAKPVQWSLQVLRGSEFQKKWNPVRRWSFSPTLSAFSHHPDHQSLTRDIVAELNESLADTPVRRIRLLPAFDHRAKIKVHFIPHADFPKFSKDFGVEATGENFGLFFIKRNPRNHIIHATILLATDKLEGDALRHFACEEITQSLGLPNDSALYRDSIFYDGDFKAGDPVSLTQRDRQLLNLLYNHLAPGHSPREIDHRITSFWNAQK